MLCTLKTGTLPKNSENLSESIVAEVTINLRSFLLATTFTENEQNIENTFLLKLLHIDTDQRLLIIALTNPLKEKSN